MLNVALFALSEGFAMSAHLNLYPKKLKSSPEKKLGGYVMNFPIQFGLLSGSLLGLALKSL